MAHAHIDPEIPMFSQLSPGQQPEVSSAQSAPIVKTVSSDMKAPLRDTRTCLPGAGNDSNNPAGAPSHCSMAARSRHESRLHNRRVASKREAVVGASREVPWPRPQRSNLL
eukprot:CAMPEP_0174746154 /NCGR_PEP_ID=MMETSP1094-20130205/88434_1 /TAXON_ID=156173 /ORGANISM="Chrysochromulina brevifilum, Strain UTEX LB 985" /LENGTH=110 /DNA_ID=CAMNT_0015950819 /DNA_START=161 /DNA_END=490 /DNA_ORIENTATION=+